MSVDIENALNHLGIEYVVRGHEANGLCPMHEERTGKPDNSPSWWINLSTGQHMCFSCHYKGGILALICDVNDFHISSWGDVKEPDYAAARLWLANLEEVSPEQLANKLKSLPTRIEELPKPVAMSDARLAIFDPPPASECASRKITEESAAAYDILWDIRKSNWIFPFRDPESNKLLGWQEKGTLTRTFMNRPPGLAKSKTLFGLKTLREDVVYLVESPLDCARFHTAGFPGAVAICGSSMSETQVKLIRNAGKVIAAFDNPKVDAAGKKACEEMLRFALKYGLNLSFFNYGDTGKKDPGDMTDEEIAWGVENSISALYGERAYV